MFEEGVNFYSGGYKIDASFWLDSKNFRQGSPIIIICSGYTGLKDIHPKRFARALTTLGYICFGFDYRGFGKSKGEPGHILIGEQVRDIENACIFITKIAAKKKVPIVLIGWGMGAGLILEASHEAPRLLGLISINGFYDGSRWQWTRRGEKNYRQFRKWLIRLRTEEVRTGKITRQDPFTMYPLDKITKKYVDNVLRKNPAFGQDLSLSFAYSLLHFAPEDYIPHLKKVPILIAHGDKNLLHKPLEAKSLYKKYPGFKEFYWIKNAGHTEWMDDNNPKFKNLIKRIHRWIQEQMEKKHK